MGKEEHIRVHFKCRAVLSKFYIQTSEEKHEYCLNPEQGV
jgi:hypothetical protein